MIKQIKLVNGDDIIGDLQKIEDYYVVKNPYKILQMVNSSGDLNIGLTPWFLYNEVDSEIFIFVQQIVAHTKPSKKIMSFYEQSLKVDTTENEILEFDYGVTVN